MSGKEPKIRDVDKEYLEVEKFFDSIHVNDDVRRVLFFSAINAQRVAESFYLLKLIVILAFVSAIEWTLAPLLPVTETRLLTSIKLLVLVVLLATWLSHEIFKYAEEKTLRRRIETVWRVQEERPGLFDEVKATLQEKLSGQGEKKNG